jgi:hypothetical protein
MSNEVEVNALGVRLEKVWLEPWAREYDLSPGSQMTIVARSEQEGELEVVAYERGTAAYGWAGSWVEVHRDGELLDECLP